MSANEQQNSDGFVVPSVPPMEPVAPASAAEFKMPSLPVQKSSAPPIKLPALQYVKPDWSARPPPATSNEDKLDSEGFSSHYFLEVIKNGSIIERIRLEKEFVSFGRLETCDVICEHPSLSRYHAILQYSNGQTDPAKYPEGFYIYDLNSTHGTFLNKTRLKPNEYIKIELDNMFKLGLSTRLFILHGPKPKNSAEDLNINVTHDQMKKIREKYSRISNTLRMRKEMDESSKREGENGGCESGVDWGLDMDEANVEGEENEEDEQQLGGENPFGIIQDQDESYYSDDPKKALKNYFDREAEDLDYEVEELGPARFKCRIRLPIVNNYGDDIYAEVEHHGKKKDCMTQCALEACRILNAKNLLKNSGMSGEEKAKKKRQKDWETADYYDSDEDNFYDRTGDLEKKRARRMAQTGGSTSATDGSKPAKSSKVHTFDSLQQDIKELIKEQVDIETKLDKCKEVIKAINDDDLDAYINSLKAGTQLDTVTRAKLKKRLAEVGSEIVKLEKLLNMAKPSTFDVKKWKDTLIEDFKAFFQDKSTSETQARPPVQKVSRTPVVRTIEAPKVTIKSTPDTKIVEKPESIKEPVQSSPVETVSSDTPAQTNTDEDTQSKRVKTETTKRKIIEPVDVEDLRSSKYDPEYDQVWLPPQDQTGDGKTKLNEKYGY